jgi:dihydrolipoamide dehydrogenase
MYDVIIIGGGPGGYVAAIKGAQLGLKVALIEKENLGGVCLNRGCIPTKSLLHIASVFSDIKKAGQLGISVSSPVIDFSKAVAKKDQLVKSLVGGIQWLMKNNGVEVVRGEADLVSEKEVAVNGNIMEAGNIIIAVGSSPVMPKIPGADNANVITSDDALALKELPKTMTIIGGGVIGVEMAFLFQSLGCATTIIEMAGRLVPMMDRDLSGGLAEMLKGLGVNIITDACVEYISSDSVTYRSSNSSSNSSKQTQSEKVLVCVGRASNGLSLSLDKVGISHKKGIIAVDERLRTNIPGIYAIGDVNGKYMLAHVASAEGIRAIENIRGEDGIMDYGAIPQCIYTAPEAASVGLTEEEAMEKGMQIKVSKIPLAANGKALAEGCQKGFSKMIMDKTSGKLLGAHILAPHAAEIITQCTIAMDTNAKIDDLVHVIFPHPSVSELLNEAIHGLNHRPIHI